MDVVPAVDLRGGRCVRLYQGDYSRETVFSSDPVAMARRWVRCGARLLHVVDLDGAARGEVCHWDVISRITRQAGVPVQVGGGIRSLDSARRLVSLGVSRIVLGTSAIEDQHLVRKACQELVEKVVVSVDARAGRVATRGWKTPTTLAPDDLVRQMMGLGVGLFIYTDITADGTLGQPDFGAVERLVEVSGGRLIAAGGISSIYHLVRLRRLGVRGAILGRALYAGKVDLRKALEVLEMPDLPYAAEDMYTFDRLKRAVCKRVLQTAESLVNAGEKVDSRSLAAIATEEWRAAKRAVKSSPMAKQAAKERLRQSVSRLVEDIGKEQKLGI